MNEDVTIIVENPRDLKPLKFEEEEDPLEFEPIKGSKVVPGGGENALSDEESSAENTEEEERRERELEIREMKELERLKKIRAFNRKRSVARLMRYVVFFQDDQNEFDFNRKIPTCK